MVSKIELKIENVERRLGTFTLALNTVIGARGGVTVLFGPSGSGKTTVLRLIAGLDLPDRGRICWGNEVWSDSGRPGVVSTQNRRIGFLFQDACLFPHLNVMKNIGYGRRSRDGSAEQWLERFHLQDLRYKFPRELSGGQKQRVAMARLLLPQPRLLLLDEPFTGMDLALKKEMLEELKMARNETGAGMIYVTHAPSEAYSLADEVIVLRDGKQVRQGARDEIFCRSEQPHYELRDLDGNGGMGKVGL